MCYDWCESCLVVGVQTEVHESQYIEHPKGSGRMRAICEKCKDKFFRLDEDED